LLERTDFEGRRHQSGLQMPVQQDLPFVTPMSVDADIISQRGGGLELDPALLIKAAAAKLSLAGGLTSGDHSSSTSPG
jgi:hypothetical protein